MRGDHCAAPLSIDDQQQLPWSGGVPVACMRHVHLVHLIQSLRMWSGHGTVCQAGNLVPCLMRPTQERLTCPIRKDLDN